MEFLAHTTINEHVDAKAKFGAEKAEELLAKAKKVIISKGKKSLEFNLSKNPDLEEILPQMLGRTGNLRAPTLVMGATLLVGFNQDLYTKYFG